MQKRIDSGEIYNSTAEQTHDDLLAELGNAEDVELFIDNKLSSLKKSLSSAKKPRSADIDKIKETRVKAERVQKGIDYWEKVKQVPITRKIEAEQKKDYEERKQREAEREQRKEQENKEQEEVKPIGKGIFGNIYDQFKGKVKEAVDFLLKHKEGDLLGVFHREEIGDIDLVWGSEAEKQGLDHIIKKHINKLHDFKDVDEAVTIIEDVINNGEMKPIINNTEKVSFEKDGYKVSVKRKVRDNQGEVIGSKNWVVTAFDKTRSKENKERKSDTTIGDQSTDRKENGTLVSPDLVSNGKDTTVSENEQEKGEKNDNDTLKEDRSAKNITESESSRKGMLGVVLDALRKAIGKENVITDSEQAQRVIDEQNGIVRPERVAEESKERAERVKNDLDLRRELKEITGAEGYGTNTAYVRGTSQDGTTYEVRVGNHIANFENFDRNNEELPQKIVSIVVMDEKFDKKTARYKSSEEINRELEEKNIDSEFQQIIIDDVKNKSQEEIQQAIEDVLFGMQVLKERGRLLFDSESAISYSKVQKNILETVSISNNKKHQQTVISSNDGAKILQNLDTLVKKIENIKQAPIKTFIGEVAKAIGAKRYGSKSEYATFETKNGKIVTIRLADHNAKVSGFDHNDHSSGISVVISAKGNEGITNDGNAHIVEYYYDAIKLRRAEGKPLAEIVRSIKQSLYSGEFKDTTGLAEREEVNASGSVLKLHKVYHGSGADFEAFDHSHMGEGEGNQAYGWGTYVTEVEGIGKTYAGAAAGLKGISYKGMTGEEVYDRADESPELDAASSVINSLLRGMDVESAINDAFKHYSKMGENEPAEEIKKLNPNDFAVIGDRILYTVEIPKDNGKNYLAWDGYVSNEQYPMWYEAMKILGEQDVFAKPEEILPFKEGHTRVSIEHEVKYLEHKHTPKAVSEALHKGGFTGIKYPAQYRSGGREDGAKNYVIFNEKDLKITDKVQFFKTKDGEAYGFTVGGKVYVDERIADASTPIHEYTHLWAEAIRKVNPKEWQNIVSLMKKQTHLWDKVKNDYPELKTDDEIADEVLAHYSGERGKKLLDEEYNKIRGNNKMNIFDKAKMLQAINNVREALRKFWKGVADFLGIHFTSAEEVADKVLSDLLEGVNPNEVKSEEKEIIEKAKADGTYMKAPNGKKSNLNEKQWVQVRTKAFKEWFGDWELAKLIKQARNAWNNKGSKDKYIFSPSKKLKDRFKELLGQEINAVIITDDAIRHIKKHHSENEELRGQVNLTPEDIATIPFVMNNWDVMELDPENNDKMGNRAILIKKRINGISAVGTIEKGKEKEFIVTSWKYIKSDALDVSKETPEPNVRNDSDIAKIQKEIEIIKKSEENSSKIVDENGVLRKIKNAVYYYVKVLFVFNLGFGPNLYISHHTLVFLSLLPSPLGNGHR